MSSGISLQLLFLLFYPILFSRLTRQIGSLNFTSSLLLQKSFKAYRSSVHGVNRIRGCIKGLTCDYQGAIVDLNSALERKHDHPAYIERAVFKFLRGDCEGALADFDYAIHHGPEQPLEVIRLRNSVKRVSNQSSSVLLMTNLFYYLSIYFLFSSEDNVNFPA